MGIHMHVVSSKTLPTITLGMLLATFSACDMPGSAGKDKDKDKNSDAAGAVHPERWPALTSAVQKDEFSELKIRGLLSTLSLEEKVAQMIQPEIRAISAEEMRQYGVGSFLNGGGAFPNDDKYATMQDWVDLAEKLYVASIDDSIDGNRIPAMWGTDAVHGHNNVLGATIFPHNIGLGAMNNPKIMREIGAITAKVVQVTGIDWAFAPTIAVVRDDRWGRTYESYSEEPQIVRAYAGEIVKGMQGVVGEDFMVEGKVIATAKHFLGDGGTVDGDDQGDNIGSEQELIDLHLQGYISALEAGVQTVMASFNSWHGKKMHGYKTMLTDVLKDQMGFDGVVVGDWDGHGQVEGCSKVSCPQAIIAGIDIIMVPYEWREMYANTVEQVKRGIIPMERIDDAVTRILRVKMRAGLFDWENPADRTYATDTNEVGSSTHRVVARRAVRQSLVMLKNDGNILPLSRKAKVLIAGDGAHNIGKQSGGWTISWQGTGNENKDFPRGTSIYDGIENIVTRAGGTATLSVDGSYSEKPDTAIVVYGENPYAEGEGDIAGLEYQRKTKTDLALLEKLKADGIPVVSVFLTGRPLWVNRELNVSDAFVVAWLPGSEGVGVSDVLFKKANNEVNHDFKGRLSFSWPKYDTQFILNRSDPDYDPLFPYGFGLTYKDSITLGNDLNERVTVAKRQDNTLLLFKNRPLDELSLSIGDAKSWDVQVVSSVQKTVDSENLVLRAVNWKVQEDARSVTWSGDSEAIAYLSYAKPKDFEGYISSNSALTFSVRVYEEPSERLDLRMDCGYPCMGSIAIDKKMRAMPVGEWRPLSIDLACFVKAGADMEKISSPFVLHTKGSASIAFADISITPNAAETADINCRDEEVEVE
ncbi:MAG: beta-glucosidase, partial [Lentisphaeria bacterium]